MAWNRIYMQKQPLVRRLFISAVMVASLNVLAGCADGTGTKNTVLLEHMGSSATSSHPRIQHSH